MAVLTNVEFTLFKRRMRELAIANPTLRADLQAAQLSKANWKAAFQAVEDGYNSRRAAIGAEVDTAAGQTLTNTIKKAMEDTWMPWKAST